LQGSRTAAYGYRSDAQDTAGEMLQALGEQLFPSSVVATAPGVHGPFCVQTAQQSNNLMQKALPANEAA